MMPFVILWMSAAFAIPRGFQVMFQTSATDLTGDIPITLVAPGHTDLRSTLHNDGKPPDRDANDRIWTTSFAETPDVNFQVSLQLAAGTLTTEVPLTLMKDSPRLVLRAQGSDLTATTSLNYKKAETVSEDAASSASQKGGSRGGRGGKDAAQMGEGGAPPENGPILIRTWTAFLPGAAVWGLLGGGLCIGIGVGLGKFSRRPVPTPPPTLRGRWPMRCVRRWAPDERPSVVIGRGVGTRVLFDPVAPDEVLKHTGELGPTARIVVLDVELLDRITAEESGLDALIRVVDGQYEVVVVSATAVATAAETS